MVSSQLIGNPEVIVIQLPIPLEGRRLKSAFSWRKDHERRMQRCVSDRPLPIQASETPGGILNPCANSLCQFSC
jgi:hypothetical protein